MSTPEPNIILIIRLSSLGDCLLMGPVLRGLRHAFPTHKIVWLTRPEYAVIWQNSEWVDEVVEWKREDNAPLEKLRSLGKIEYVLDLQASPKSRSLVQSLPVANHAESAPPRWRRTLQIITKHNWLVNEPPVPLRYLKAAEPWGVKDDGKGLELPLDNDALLLVQSSWGHKKRIGLAPGSKHFTKRWPLHNYVTLAHKIIEAGYGIVWIVGPDEILLIGEIERNGLSTNQIITFPDWGLPKLFAAVSLCTAVVTNDSAAMHIAAGTGCPGVALFGPTIQEFGFAPFRSHVEVMGRDLWCRPCSAHGGKKCPLKHHKCMKEISVDMVWKKLHSEHIGV